jgi:hypothetical protein
MLLAVYFSEILWSTGVLFALLVLVSAVAAVAGLVDRFNLL